MEGKGFKVLRHLDPPDLPFKVIPSASQVENSQHVGSTGSSQANSLDLRLS